MDGYVVPDLQYVHPDLTDDPRPDPFAQIDLAMTRRVAGVVNLHYPGHPWLIEVTHEQGVVMISIPLFSGMTNKWVIKLSDLKSDPGMKEVMRTCGEILERYRLPRCGWDHSQFMAALNALPINRRGTHGYVPV